MVRKLFLSGVVAVLAMTPLQAQDRRRATYILSGLVVTDEGLPFPEPVEMFLVCSGAVMQKAFSQDGGQFTFQLAENTSQTSGNLETAGSPSGGGFRQFNQMGRGQGDGGSQGSGRVTKFGRMNLNDCEITGAVPGHSSSVLALGMRDILENPAVGSVTMHRLGDTGGATVSLHTATASPKALKAYNKARAELDKAKPNHSKAIRHLEKAVKIFPDFSRAWYLLGKARLSEGKTQEAEEAFRKASLDNPDYLEPLVELAEMALQSGDLNEASRLSAQVVGRDPDSARSHYIRAYAEHGRGNAEVAEESLHKVLESPQVNGYPGTHYLLGIILANRGELQTAAAQLRRFLHLQPSFPGAPQIHDQLSSWERQGLIEGRRN